MSLVIGVSAIDFERWGFIFVGSTRFNPIGTQIVENAHGDLCCVVAVMVKMWHAKNKNELTWDVIPSLS